MRASTLLAIVCLVSGVGTCFGYFAMLAWTGETIVEHEFERHRRPKKKKGQKRQRRVEHRVTIGLDPDMNPLGGTLFLPGSSSFQIKVLDPDGIEVHSDKGNANDNGDQTRAAFVKPFEVARAGDHEIVWWTNWAASGSLQVRRNIYAASIGMFFAGFALVFVGMVTVMIKMFLSATRQVRAARERPVPPVDLGRSLVFAIAFATVSASAVQSVSAQRPRAWVLERVDGKPGTGELAANLKRANFHVRALPLDRSPRELRGLIAFGSWTARMPQYKTWAARWSKDLQAAVSEGSVVLQLTQADKHEKSPRFLPKNLVAIRGDRDTSVLRCLRDDHPLLARAPLADGLLRLNSKISGWEMFGVHARFGPLLVSTDQRRSRALMEVEHGSGRFVLAAIALESHSRKEGKELVEAKFRTTFFRGLRHYVVACGRGEAPPVVPVPELVEPIPFTAGSWTLALLPDTQYYAAKHPKLFAQQTRWLVDHKAEHDIRFVLHLGDITNSNTNKQWQRARSAMRTLDGALPYAICSGNHDMGPGGHARTRATGMHQYFGGAYLQQPTLGGRMAQFEADNTYHLFEAGGRKWIVVSLEWAPRDAAVRWADRVLREHADRSAIVITHWYLNADGTRSDAKRSFGYKTPGPVNLGEQLWLKLLRKHDVRFVFNGHVGGDGVHHLRSRNRRGKVCHQIVSNYQFGPMGGGGWLRLMEFCPDGEVVVRTYSPYCERWFLEPDHQFRLRLD